MSLELLNNQSNGSLRAFKLTNADYKTVTIKPVRAHHSGDIDITAYELSSVTTPLHVCDCKAPIPHEYDMEMMQKYNEDCQLRRNPPEQTNIMLLEGLLDMRHRYGRTGNNLWNSHCA